MRTSDLANTEMLLKLKGAFGNELSDPTLARIQEIEKATGRLHEMLFSRESVDGASEEDLESRHAIIDKIERDLLLIPRERCADLIHFLKTIKGPSCEPALDPIARVIEITEKLELLLHEWVAIAAEK